MQEIQNNEYNIDDAWDSFLEAGIIDKDMPESRTRKII